VNVIHILTEHYNCKQNLTKVAGKFQFSLLYEEKLARKAFVISVAFHARTKITGSAGFWSLRRWSTFKKLRCQGFYKIVEDCIPISRFSETVEIVVNLIIFSN
jgi:hypothetical protein